MSKRKQNSRSELFERPAVLAASILVVIVILALLALWAHKSTPDTTTVTATDSSILKLPELGVSIKLTDNLKGLRSSTSNLVGHADVVKLSTEKYTSLANKCLAHKAGTEESFAALYRGQSIPGVAPSQKPLKQFDNFYIANLGPTYSNPVCNDQSVQKDFNSLSTSLNDELDTAFANAQKL